MSNRRKQLGLSLSDVGRVVGCTPQAISRYEKGIVKIDLSLVDSFCNVLNLSTESFFAMDPKKITGYRNEKFDQDAFSSFLKGELDQNEKLIRQVAGALSVSTARIGKWCNGESLPSVGEFLILAKNLECRPVDLCFGREEPGPEPLARRKRWRLPLLSVCASLAIAACILIPVSLSRLYSSHPEDSTSTVNPPRKKTFRVSIQGYDVEDGSEIQSLQYHYEIGKGEMLGDFSPKSPYYDYLGLKLDDRDFDERETPIERDLALSAFFSKKTFQVNFLGYEGEPLGHSKVKYLSAAIPPDTVEDCGDFRFVSWKEDFSCVKSDMNVHALFSRFRCNLALDFAGGQSGGESSEVYPGYTDECFDSLPKPIKKGHRFLYYADQRNQKFGKGYDLDGESVHLHAVYEPLTYSIHFEGLDQTQSVTYGSQVTSLPKTLKGNDIVLGWTNNGKKVTLPFTYEDDFDIILRPIMASEYFDYELKDGKVTLNGLKKCDEPDLDLTSFGDYPITRISSHALKDSDQIESLTFHQKDVHLESSCFENLPSLRRVYFDSVDSTSVFDEAPFSHCPNVTYLRSGIPAKSTGGAFKLKDYGLEGGEDFTFEFNEETKNYPTSWNEGFGVLGELRMGDGIVTPTTVRGENCKILRFVPGRVGYSMLTLSLPDIEQEEMRFYGTSLVRIEGEKFGKVQRFIMKNGGVSVNGRAKALEVEEFDMSGSTIFAMRDQQVKADHVVLSDCAEEGYFAPLQDNLVVDFYGCDSMPDALLSRDAFTDSDKTTYHYHAEKHYQEDDIVEYPITLWTW